METKINYTVVGLFVFVLGVLGLMMFFWLTNNRHDKVYNTYLVFVKEDVTGLNVQSPVRFNGVPVGFVKSIDLDTRNPQLVRLKLQVEQKVPITTSTVASLQFQGITGVLYVGLKAVTESAPLLKPSPGQLYPVIPWQPSLIVQLSQVLPEMTKNLRIIGDRIRHLLNDENQKAIHNSLVSIETFTKMLDKHSKEFGNSIVAMDKVLTNAQKASHDFPVISKQLIKTLNSIDKTTNTVTKATLKFSRTINKGNIAMRSIAYQLVPTAQSAIYKFNGVMDQLQQLGQELLQNPAMLVRGRQPRPPGPGEK